MSAVDLDKEEKQKIGKCAYCGQTKFIQTLGEVSQAELDAMATDQCLCFEAQTQKRKKAREAKVMEYVKKKFVTDKMIEYILASIKMLEDGNIEEFTIKLDRDKVCKIWMDSDNYLHIRIKKTEDDELKA